MKLILLFSAFVLCILVIANYLLVMDTEDPLEDDPRWGDEDF